METDELTAGGDNNLAVTWGRLGIAAGFATERLPSMTLTSSGLPIPYFNGAFVRPGVEDGEIVVAQACAFFSNRAVPWLLWVRQDAERRVSDACRRGGVSDTGGPQGMVLADLPSESPQHPPPALTVGLATDHADLLAVRYLIGAGFAIQTSSADGHANAIVGSVNV